MNTSGIIRITWHFRIKMGVDRMRENYLKRLIGIIRIEFVVEIEILLNRFQPRRKE